jgi:uncharacterized protein (TIGR02145 family)
MFITEEDEPTDWRVDQNNTLWKNEASENNVCPKGYRLPTAGVDNANMEWDLEINSWNINNLENHDDTNSSHALQSNLKLPLARYHDYRGGIRTNNLGDYWSADANGTKSYNLFFNTKKVKPSQNLRAYGFSVRCIKD